MDSSFQTFSKILRGWKRHGFRLYASSGLWYDGGELVLIQASLGWGGEKEFPNIRNRKYTVANRAGISTRIAISPGGRGFMLRGALMWGCCCCLFSRRGWCFMDAKGARYWRPARFGMILFQILAPLQLIWAAFFSAILAAAAVAHEKDRGRLYCCC